VDARKSLDVLHEEWKDCTKCELGTRRKEVNGQFVFGEGSPRGILFIGEGPGKVEEQEGRPFVGPSGKILRAVLEIFKFKQFYITNIVACRSCSPVLNPDGTPVIKKYGQRPAQPIYRDEPPTPRQIEACMSRLHEQIYLLDPVLIVSLGAPATEALVGRPVAITQERGKERHITIPGASYKASLTNKRKACLRKINGKLTAPVEPNQVRYLLIPTLHPAFVARRLDDRGPKSPIRQFAYDIRKAIRVYERYMFEVFDGIEHQIQNDVTDEQIEETVANARTEENHYE
jgi:uracil-DNA glycosylase